MEVKLLKENTGIQTHINILQGIISRMATNSSNCKTWAITIIAAIIVLLIDKSKTNIFYIAYVPLSMFFLLDCFYLGLERHFRKLYNEFIGTLENDDFNYIDVYKIQGPNNLLSKIALTLKASISFSIFPFYGIIAILIYIVQKIS